MIISGPQSSKLITALRTYWLRWQRLLTIGPQRLTENHPARSLMRRLSYTEEDGLMQLFFMPIFLIALNWILLDNRYWSNWRVFGFTTIISGILSYGCWLINNAIGLYGHRLFPHPQQTLIRVTYLFGSCILSGFTVIFTIYSIYTLADSPTFMLRPGRLGWALVFDLIVIVLIVTIYEGIIAFYQWQKTLVETEQLKKANLQSQLDGLKSQVNPHFLFNSLNSLSSLIEDDPEQAERFVDEMSSVYRYLLRSNETEMVTLAAEMEFVQSYFHLLRTRYGDHIRLEEAVDTAYATHLLPPLTLQLLLENAVKHNIILPEQPLTIRIETRPESDRSESSQSGSGRLVVQNNLQRRPTRVLSNQVGLANIATKYRLLGHGELIVHDDDQFFTVTLPLISAN